MTTHASLVLRERGKSPPEYCNQKETTDANAPACKANKVVRLAWFSARLKLTLSPDFGKAYGSKARKPTLGHNAFRIKRYIAKKKTEYSRESKHSFKWNFYHRRKNNFSYQFGPNMRLTLE